MLEKKYADAWIARFWSKVDMSAGPDGCWPWKGSINEQGYGRTTYQSKPKLAHRVAWEIANGQSMGRLCGLHRCDNPPCVNPAHIWPGTRTENGKDMGAKGRARKGEAHSSAVLNEERVRMIRALSGAGFRQRSIAAAFGVSQSAVAWAVSRRSWKHLDDDPAQAGSG